MKLMPVNSCPPELLPKLNPGDCRLNPSHLETHPAHTKDMAAAPPKTDAASKVASATLEVLRPELDDIRDRLTAMMEQLAAIASRQEMANAGASTGKLAARAPKSGAARPKADADADPRSKVKSNILFHRYMWLNDKAFREEQMAACSEIDFESLFADDANVQRHTASGDDAKRLGAEHTVVWRAYDTEAKKDVTLKFEAWRAAQAAPAAQLDADDAE